jgi:integrase
VEGWHAKIGRENGQYAANRARALLSSLYNASPRILSLNLNNPAKGVQRFPEQQRERFLQPDELQRFLAALEDEPDELMRDFFKLCLFTGARRSNVQAMRWDCLNLPRRTWTIPAAEAKAKADISVHLSQPAVDVLTARKLTARPSAVFVFPGHGRSGHLVEPKAAWARVLKAAELDDLRLHDLRRTLGSWQASSGASLLIIGKSLGHKSLQAAAVYARLNLDPVRASVDAATSAMIAAAEAEKAKKQKSG